MNTTIERPTLLFIEPPGNENLHTALRQQFNVVVQSSSPDDDVWVTIRHIEPDLIVLDVDLPTNPPQAVLSVLKARSLNLPVVLIGEVAEIKAADFDYAHIIGWLNRPLVATTLAEVAMAAIKTARLYQEAQQHNRELQLANEISRLISSTLEMAEIPRLLLERTTEIVEAECGSVAFIDKQRKGVVFQLAYDEQGQEIKGLKNFIMPLDEGIVGLVSTTGQPVIANDVKNHPAWSPLSDRITGFTTEKMVAVPLIAEGETIGVVELLNKQTGDFGQNDVKLLSLVAASAASAIQNARRYQTLKRANQSLRKAHKQHIATERWTILGKAAANLAHRINNTTTLIPIAAQHTQELLAQVEMPPELRTDIEGNLDRIRRNSLYTVELAMVLLRRFRKQPTEAHDVNELVKKALDSVIIPGTIKLVTHLDPELPPADTSDMLIDVLVELITNAVKILDQEDGLVHIATFETGQEKIAIQITDNGPGIAAADIDKIFDIFYTTSPAGLGFGLWWVKTFLEQQGSEISVESLPNEHTTFTVTLPQDLSALRSFQK